MIERELRRSKTIAPERGGLLDTKLALPRAQASLVPRESLLAQLDRCLEQRLTLLCAPAGYGKTALLRAWIASRAAAPDRRAVAWVSLDAGDNDPARFWSYLLAACRRLDASVNRALSERLDGPRGFAMEEPQGAFEAELTPFLNALARLSRPCVLVLEDYHHIVEPRIHATVAALVDYLPASLPLVLVTRSEPPLPLARWRAHGDLGELRANDLRFSPEETRAFLQQTLPFSLSEEAVARLQDRTEGWAAGLHLASLALRERTTPAEGARFLATFSGSHRSIAEYLRTEAFDAQPEPLQTFLLQVGVLPRLTAALCEAVTGRADSAQLLEQLERGGLFLERLEEDGGWYRFHPLFAEAIGPEARRRLGEEEVGSLARQASLWYEDAGRLADAVEAAFAAQDDARAARLLEKILASPGSAEAQAYHMLHRWLERLPDHRLRQHPWLCLTYAMILLFAMPRTAANRTRLESLLQTVEQAAQDGNDPVMLGAVPALRCVDCWRQGDPARALAFSRQALTWLPDSETSWRGLRRSMMGAEELHSGALAGARQALLEARALHESAGNRSAARAMRRLLADVCALQGELHQAAELYRQTLAEVDDDLSDRAGVLNGLAALSYEWNELERAAVAAQEALALGRQMEDAGHQVRAGLILARVQHARGETAQAQQRLYALAAQMQQGSSVVFYRDVCATQARLALALGDVAGAQRWVDTDAEPEETLPPLQQEREDLLRARLWIAQGEAEAALRLLERRQAEAQGQTLSGRQVENRMLQAQACTAHSPKEARQRLICALTLAQSEGYRRLFLDEGEPMASLLRASLRAVREVRLQAYIQSLLDDFVREQAGSAEPDTGSSSAFMPLAEPLSPQEQRVLRLLAAGHATPEIARRLFVSVTTVRTQVQSIYRKLNVNNRVAACETAHRLQLLS